MASFIDLPQQEEFTETIDKIIDLRSKRKYLFETNINENDRQRQALDILKERVDVLRQTSQDIHSSVSSFNNRVFLTEDSDYISGQVKANAAVGDYEIEILQLGDKQLLVSTPLPKEVSLKESRIEIEIAGEKIRFNFEGGNPQNFARVFNEALKGHFTANWIRKSEEENFFVVQANQVGKSSSLNLRRDTGDVFVALKLLKPKPPIIKTLVNTKSLAEIGWVPYDGDMDGVIVPPGAVPDPGLSGLDTTTVSPTNENLGPGVLPLNLTVNFLETQHIFFKLDVFLEPNVNLMDSQRDGVKGSSLSNQDPGTSSGQSKQVATGPLREKIIQELKIKNEPIMVLEYFAEDELRSKTFTWNNVFNDRIWINDIRLGAELDKNVEFRSVKFINDSKYPYVIGKWFRSLYNTNQDKYLPVNEKTSPSKVKFRFYSIEMERDQPVIDNLIDGVTLNLLKVKEGPVRFSIQNNTNGYNQQIRYFVGQYNYTLDFINLSLAPDKESLAETEVDPAMEDMIGVFNADMNIQRLKDKMREILQNGYKVNENERTIYLQEIGITVFNSLAKPYHINSAKIDLDQELFQSKLLEYGDDIKNLFRYDKNGDYIPDDGFAYQMDELLGEYLAPNSIFTSMERNLERQKKSLSSSLESEQGRIDRYREKLEIDFSKVKQAREQQKQLQNWLNPPGE